MPTDAELLGWSESRLRLARLYAHWCTERHYYLVKSDQYDTAYLLDWAASMSPALLGRWYAEDRITLDEFEELVAMSIRRST